MTEFVKYLNLKVKNDCLHYISDESGMRQLYKYRLEDGLKEQLTEEEQNVKNYWFVDGRLMISTDYHGNEREQFKLIDEGLALTDEPDYYHHYGIEAEGNIIFFRNHQEKREFELCISTLKGEGRILKVFESPMKILSKFKDNQILLSRDVTNIDSEFYIYDIENDRLTELQLPSGRFQKYNRIDDGSAVFVSDFDTGYLNLYTLNTETWQYKKLTDFKWNIEHLLIDDDKSTAYLTLNENGFSRLYQYDLNEATLKSLDLPMGGVVHSLKKEGDLLYFIHSAMDQPHSFYKYDISSGELERLFGNRKLENDIEADTGTFVSFDNLDVPYYIYRQHGENIKTVIHIHGGPESQARPEFNELYYKLYREGYQIAVPNIRGSTGYHKFYIGLDDQLKRMDALEDIVQLRQHLVDREKADTDHIFVMGRSYGGFMTLLAVTQRPDLWRGAVDIVGISHLRTLLQNTSSWRRTLRSHEYGFIGEHDAFFEAIAPLENTGAIEAPLRIFHSTNDVRVPYTESEQMYAKMKRRGQDVEFIAYENEGHQYLHTRNIADMDNEIIKFFNDLSR